MKNFSIVMSLATVALSVALAQDLQNPFAGRWDMTVTAGDDKYPNCDESSYCTGGLYMADGGTTAV